MQEFVEKLGNTFKTMAQSYRTLKDMLAMGNTTYEGDETIQEMNRLLHNFEQKFSTGAQESSPIKPQTFLTQDDELFNDPTILAQIDEIVLKTREKFKQKEKMSSNYPFDGPSFKLFPTQDDPLKSQDVPPVEEQPPTPLHNANPSVVQEEATNGVEEVLTDLRVEHPDLGEDVYVEEKQETKKSVR